MDELNAKNLEQEMINVIRLHYIECNGKPTPLAALKQHFGREFSFKKTGLGSYGVWMQLNKHHFQVEQTTAKFLNEIETTFHKDLSIVTEEALLITVKAYFSQSEYFCHRRHVLNHIRDVYGDQPFGKLGYGTFPEF